ncbi:hypothetical protein ABIC83_002938 [Roseateles asaccharophilus]|uniref:hypothetical protein n=1 Tax=Roseateles asaccharophilus TaxID=582607 RepID=UPI003837923F
MPDLKIMKAVLNIAPDRVSTMVQLDVERSLCAVNVTIESVEGRQDMTIVSGSTHGVMRVIGILADHGEECLVSASNTSHAEELEAAVAYVELHTGNGVRKQPPEWAINPDGQFNAQVIADRGRAAAARYQA